MDLLICLTIIKEYISLFNVKFVIVYNYRSEILKGRDIAIISKVHTYHVSFLYSNVWK